ncbi:MAG: ATP-binding cassette domain-containing protein, partial [Chitinophagaceae bacterium]
MLELTDVSVSLAGKKILDHISVRMELGQQWAITGRTGSGKTSLAKVITGDIFYSGTKLLGAARDARIPNEQIAPSPDGHTIARISFVPQEHQFKNLNNTSDFYYQQRFNSSEAGQSLIVSDLLDPDNNWIDLLHLRELVDRPILQLSNGENKRLQLAQKLQDKPDILILDNPFLGLDVSGRTILGRILAGLIEFGVQVILIAASSDLPAFVTHVLSLNNGKVDFSGTRVEFEDYQASRVSDVHHINSDLLRSLKPAPWLPFEFAVRMINVNISYDGKIVLENINWELKRGDCWSLSGPNGAGKSTLLSLITGDNPQAYANDIFLFDRKRGTGESIWDIKHNIGFVSPELHLFFDQGASC